VDAGALAAHTKACGLERGESDSGCL